MNIDDLTFGDLKQIVAMFGGQKVQDQQIHPSLGKYVVVRTFAAGVHVGTLKTYDFVTRHATLENSRRIWSWSGAFTLSAVANDGIKDGKMSQVLPVNTISQVEEIMQVANGAKERLESFKVYTP